jgi:hypothetical protein
VTHARYLLPEPRTFTRSGLCAAFVFADPLAFDALLDALGRAYATGPHPNTADLFTATAAQLRERTAPWALCAYWALSLAAEEHTRT